VKRCRNHLAVGYSSKSFKIKQLVGESSAADPSHFQDVSYTIRLEALLVIMENRQSDTLAFYYLAMAIALRA
jgi:hypothetical protein